MLLTGFVRIVVSAIVAQAVVVRVAQSAAVAGSAVVAQSAVVATAAVAQSAVVSTVIATVVAKSSGVAATAAVPQPRLMAQSETTETALRQTLAFGGRGHRRVICHDAGVSNSLESWNGRRFRCGHGDQSAQRDDDDLFWCVQHGYELRSICTETLAPFYTNQKFHCCVCV